VYQVAIEETFFVFLSDKVAIISTSAVSPVASSISLADAESFTTPTFYLFY
jgi:hypothetical protein